MQGIRNRRHHNVNKRDRILRRIEDNGFATIKRAKSQLRVNRDVYVSIRSKLKG